MWHSLFARFRKDRCSQTRDLLSAYTDGQLDLKEQERVEQHLKVCPACREEIGSLQATVQLLHRVPQESPARSFAVAEPRPVPRWSPFPVLRTATAVVAVFLVFFFAADMYNLFGTGPAATEERGAMQSESGQEEADAGKYSPDSENDLSGGPESDDDESQLQATEEGYAAAGDDGTDQEEVAGGDEETTRELEGETSVNEGGDGWPRAVEYGLLGAMVVLGSITIVSWRKGRKAKI
ncbi:MAG: zf-HC2 domain-containing protein [Chloroflexi bacterium]|nr:zf-HC2 domain-containing protein [Chloroflexota bacterium]